MLSKTDPAMETPCPDQVEILYQIIEKHLILAPDIVKLIWKNRHPSTLTLDKLRKGIPESWEEQRRLFLP